MEKNNLKKRHGVNGNANGTTSAVGDNVLRDDQHKHAEREHEHDSAHGHSHGHDHDHDSEDIDALLEVLKGRGDRGSRIAFVGLLANVGLTGIKGVSGWYLNSAALIADAAHSLSDLMGDIVTLVCYSVSRRSPSPAYPYGYGKFETFGTTIMSLFLLAGASAIAAHSYSQCPPLPFLSRTTAASTSPLDEHEDVDPNAAWFALLSILAKEYLYRLSSKVAREENSPVLMANALHHRSDMWSSFVSLIAILGSWLVPGLPLDPLGGILVSVLILQQGLGILYASIKELTDAGVSPSTLSSISSLLKPILSASPSSSSSSSKYTHVIAIRDIRALRRGGNIFVDLTVELPRNTSMQGALGVEERIRKTVMEGRKEVREVKVQFCVEGEVLVH
ncbi:hypothetical protein BOTBODRAFT_36534 [Botryobasidium botryosum FD-172 SS1]|uniref:Cation efflux protein transmembrane domain-containing protein n=1 Tax=Botryobasidium botryosum (strain FD-172 SS1) TaxID=930990 RepID=A0A067M3F8_BOTB1|nr:hypothetical protein BOTBODRAFT_36534 [Botryobasidium botryosum FD-172 SS1]